MSRRFGLIAAIAILNWACLGPLEIEQPLSQDFASLATVKTLEVVSDGKVLMKGTFADGPEATSGKSERTVALASESGTGPSGTAEIEIDRVNGLSDEKIEIKLKDLPFPASCRLMADGKELTVFSTMEKGKLNLQLSRRVTVAK